MPKAEYKSAQRSRQAIVDALIRLTEEKPLTKITVTDIVGSAEISRSTFYTHFEDMDDLIRRLEEYVVDGLERVLTSMKLNFTEEGVLKVLMGVSDTLERDQKLVTVLFSSDDTTIMARMRRCFVDHMTDSDAIPAVIRADPEFNAMIRFFAGGASNLYQAWFRGELGGSLQDIAQLLCRAIIRQSKRFYKA